MKLKDYQHEAIRFLMKRLVAEEKPGAGLWLDMGLGKTAVTLHTIHLLRQFGIIRKVLVTAPKRVVTTGTWENEVEKWGLDIPVQALTQNVKSRKNPWASNAELYTISCDSLRWLERQGRQFDLLVIDEATKFKAWQAKRTLASRRLTRFIPRRITLTGTPVPNGLHEIFAQHYLLDGGETLGSKIRTFRQNFCQPCGYEMKQWEVRPECVQPLQDLIAPWYLHQSALDHLDMPERVRNTIAVQLPDAAMELYQAMLKEFVVELDSGTAVAALSAGSKYNALRQIASGSIYNSEHNAEHIHNAKLEALEDLLDDLNGKPLIVAYWYRHEMAQLARKFPKIRAINGDTSDADSRKAVEDWKARKIRLLAVQSSSLSHGVDGLQYGGCNDLCWYTLTDQPELFQQLEGRLFRQGIVGQVRFHYLLAEKTVDRAIYNTLLKKGAKQRDVLNAVKDYAHSAPRASR